MYHAIPIAKYLKSAPAGSAGTRTQVVIKGIEFAYRWWDRQPVAGVRLTMAAGQSTQPGAVSCDEPAQKLHLFPREVRSLAIADWDVWRR